MSDKSCLGRSKTFLKCARARIKQSQARKINDSKVLAKEIGALLVGGREEMARIKVEHLIRNKSETHAIEIVELFCDLVLARHMLLEQEEKLPKEMQEAVYSLCWAANRTEVAELGGVKDQFCLKYDEVRRQFMPRAEDMQGPAAAERPEQTRYVNAKLQDYLSVATPPRDKIIAYLVEIARVHAPGWEPAPELADPTNPDLIDLSYTGHAQGGGGGGGAMGPPPPPPPVMVGHTTAGDVSVTFTDALLGMDLAGMDHTGREAANPDMPTACVVVTGMRPGTQAEASGQVTRGLAIKAVNRTPIIGGYSFNQTIQCIQSAGRPVSIVLGPPPPMAAAQPPPGYAPRGEPAPGFGAPPGYGAPPGFGAVPAVVTAAAVADPLSMFPAVPVSVPLAAPAPAPAVAAPADFDDLEARFQALKTAGS